MFAAEQLEPQPAQFNLDTVRDCGDLAGTWPPSVKLKFVLWEHGDSDTFHLASNTARLGRYLQGAALVALEDATGTVYHRSKEDTDQEYALINDVIAGRLSRASYLELPVGQVRPLTLDNVLGIVQGLQAVGTPADALPQFVPVDIYHDDDDPKSDDESARGPSGPAEMVTWMRRRENVTIRQLHGLAQRLAGCDEPKEIAVVYGTAHSLLPVATRTLGAPTSRVFVDEWRNSDNEYVEHAIRFAPDDAVPVVALALAKAARFRSYPVFMLAQKWGAHATGQEVTKTEFAVCHDLGLLCVRAGRQNLTTNQRQRFAADMAIIAEQPDLFRKQDRPQERYVQAAERLVALSVETKRH